jgi:hypothetical protein
LLGPGHRRRNDGIDLMNPVNFVLS